MVVYQFPGLVRLTSNLLFLEFRVTRDAPPSVKINLAPWKLVKLEGQYKYIETERKVAILLVSALSTTQI